MSQCQRDVCHTSKGYYIYKRFFEEKKKKKNCSAQPLIILFLTVSFGRWAHFHKHSDPLNKMKIITDKSCWSKKKKEQYVAELNNECQRYLFSIECAFRHKPFLIPKHCKSTLSSFSIITKTPFVTVSQMVIEVCLCIHSMSVWSCKSK